MKSRVLILFSMLLIGSSFSAPFALHAQDATDPEAAPPKSPAQLLAEHEDRAIREVLEAARSDDPQLRAQAMEAIQPRPKRALPLTQIALEDENPAVRFAALVTIGDLRLAALGDNAARLQDDPDPSVRAAAMYAAHACGKDSNMNELPRLLGSDDATVRANAAMVLGLMGDRSAIPMIREIAQRPMRRTSPVRETLVRLQFAEALAMLGEEQEIEVIRAAMFSPEYEVRVLAVLMLGRLQDRSMTRAMIGFLDETPIELKLAATQALAQMGVEAGRPVALAAATYDGAAVARQAEAFIRQNKDSPYVPTYRQMLGDPAAQQRIATLARGQAAFALAELGGPDATAALVGLLDDPDPGVRLAAAAGVLKARP